MNTGITLQMHVLHSLQSQKSCKTPNSGSSASVKEMSRSELWHFILSGKIFWGPSLYTG